MRHVRFADGPDAVHLREVGKVELKREPSALAIQISGTNANVAKYGKFQGESSQAAQPAVASPPQSPPRARL